jgi:hypothetical protein
MGFNFFKIVNLKDSFRKKLNGFVQNLGPAIRDGKTITLPWTQILKHRILLLIA